MPATRIVLLVDDEKNITNALRRELKDWASQRDLEIATASSPSEGLAFMEAHGDKVAIVVSDLKMPGMLGSDFLLEVHRLHPEAMAILLTGYSEATEIAKIVKAGIFSFILKPWESDYLISELSKALEHHDLREAVQRHARVVDDELRWAGEMQRSILRPNLPKSDGIEYRVSYRPVPGLYCGGDYYDVIFLGNDRYLVLIGDVEGHGVKAAFVTGILKATIFPEFIRTYIGKPFSPGAFLSWLNDRMNFEFRSSSSMIISFFAGVIDLRTGTIAYANAGHNHPFLIRGPKAFELPVSGSALGFADKISFAEQAVRLAGGDILVFYTDGLVEAGSATEFSPLRLGPILEATSYGPDYHRRLLEMALSASQAADFKDDVTLVTARLG